MDTIYLVQHGQAADKDEDPKRPLTALGREETERVATLAADLDLSVNTIWHSGKTRAQETAEIYGRILSVSDIVGVQGMHPLDDVQPIANRVAELIDPIMLVGHLPFMERMVGYLTNGNAEASPVSFRNSGIVCLKREEGQWRAAWQLNPL